MVRLPKLLLACLAVALLLPATAQADQTDEANRLVDQANALLEESGGFFTEINDLLTSVSQIDPAADNAADALPLLNEATDALDDMTATDESILSLAEQAAALDVSPEFSVYLGQQEEVARLSLELDGLVGALIAKQKTAYSRWGKLSGSERDELGAEIDDLITQWNALASEMAEKQAASDEYYADKGIGEGSDGSRSWIDYVLRGGWVVAIVAVMGFRSWRKRRQGLVECATCSLEVPAKTGRCPNCGGRLRVPRPPPADEAGASASSGAPEPGSAQSSAAESPVTEAPLDQSAAAAAEPRAVADASEELAAEAEAAAETPYFAGSTEEAWEPPGGGPAYEESVDDSQAAAEDAQAAAEDAQAAAEDGDTREA
jgi:hypothetical protein